MIMLKKSVSFYCCLLIQIGFFLTDSAFTAMFEGIRMKTLVATQNYNRLLETEECKVLKGIRMYPIIKYPKHNQLDRFYFCMQ